MENITCFLISLKSDQNKRDKNLPNVKKLFPNTKVFDAFDARNLSDTELKKYVHPATYNQIKQKREVDMLHMGSKGGVGCFISHKNLWKKCIELNEPIIICEDDIQLDKSSSINKVKKSFNSIPNDTVFAALIGLPINFLAPSTKGTKVISKNWKTVGHDFMGTQMYYITPYAASLLLYYSEPIVNHVDMYIGQVALQDENKWLRVRNNLNPQSYLTTIENDFNSSVGHTLKLKKILPEHNNFWFIFISIVFLLIIIIIIQGFKIRNLKKKYKF
jgi:glycosyl transferase family 25